MNLIEQLGGYDFVKKMWIDGGSLRGTQLEFELLEHRRAHNIFEVGDKVVCWVTGRIGLVDCFLGDWTCMVKITNDIGGFTFVKNHLEAIVHATDEEIEAGRRL